MREVLGGGTPGRCLCNVVSFPKQVSHRDTDCSQRATSHRRQTRPEAHRPQRLKDKRPDRIAERPVEPSCLAPRLAGTSVRSDLTVSKRPAEHMLFGVLA